MLLESNKYGQKDHWNVISHMYSYLKDQCISKYMRDCWITGSLDHWMKKPLRGQCTFR